jgi:hypothetical protein
MPFEQMSTGRTVILRWKEVTKEDVGLLAGLIQAKASEFPGKLVVIAVSDERTGKPDSETRDQFNKMTKEMAKQVESLHFIFGGRGLGNAAMRAVVTGMLMMSGARNMHMDADVRSAVSGTTLSPTEQEQVLHLCKTAGIKV